MPIKKKRTFIIGAGFSKALADAPLSTEILGEIYNKSEEVHGKSDAWIYGRKCFIEVLQELSKTVQPGLEFLEKNGTEVINRQGKELFSSINIEYLCTLLDLNINRPFIPEGEGVDLKGFPIPFMENFTQGHIEAARDFIIYHLWELCSPENLNPNQDLLDKFIRLIKKGDTVITFNYDIIIEQYLWQNKLWNPRDGYGIGEPYHREDWGRLKSESSKVSVIKPHGSINWYSPSVFDSNIQILTWNPFSEQPYFKDIQTSVKVPLSGGRKYQQNNFIPKLSDSLYSYL